MALLNSELEFIKFSLGFNVLTVGAVPYISIAQIFEQVIQPYMSSGASTTSSTTVVVATTATPVALTLASATGFDAFARVVIDVDDLQEVATVRSISGSAITVPLLKAHTGTYPVTVEGGESIIRGLLNRLRTIEQSIADTSSSAGIKKVDEIEFFGDGKSKTSFELLQGQQAYWRSELCRALFGVGDLRQLGRRGSVRTEMY